MSKLEQPREMFHKLFVYAFFGKVLWEVTFSGYEKKALC